MTNILVFDRDPKKPVWNHPIRGYRVTYRQEFSEQQAARSVHPSLYHYIFNNQAARFMKYVTELYYIDDETVVDVPTVDSSRIDHYTRTMYLEYILELDYHGRIIGGEWTGHSKEFHPDFAWFPNRYLMNDNVAGIMREHVEDIYRAGLGK
jgi:hypothetical protein